MEQGNLVDFAAPFLTSHLITYIGNKRTLLPFINAGIERVKSKLNKSSLIALDGFAGSGAVSRLLKEHSSILYSNDIEAYSYIVNKCYLSNSSEVDMAHLTAQIDELNALAHQNLIKGFIYNNYAPKDDVNIQAGERAFYTGHNAKMLDTLKKLIYEQINELEQHFFLAPLIVAASIHTNTSGVFKGFHKKDGIGCFGGAGKNALSRILKNIELKMPIFSKAECETDISRKDINELARGDTIYDIAYYDPPYNQHPYGSNYFMLNILATPETEIPIQNGVSGIAENWNRSAYNKREMAITAMDNLIAETKAKYILISYNNEGIIPFAVLKGILEKYGKVELLEQDYNTYRGSRNLSGRNIKVKELLWILNKG
ncbi:DNA adenine methylase [Deferribacterales bacterium RsTz2092]